MLFVAKSDRLPSLLFFSRLARSGLCDPPHKRRQRYLTTAAAQVANTDGTMRSHTKAGWLSSRSLASATVTALAVTGCGSGHTFTRIPILHLLFQLRIGHPDRFASPPGLPPPYARHQPHAIGEDEVTGTTDYADVAAEELLSIESSLQKRK